MLSKNSKPLVEITTIGAIVVAALEYSFLLFQNLKSQKGQI
jgi:hypothetical protein